MQAVILAAGHGTRMDELTTAIPKPMIDLEGKPLLQYKLDVLDERFDEVIIIVGYEGKLIRNFFGGVNAGKPIKYVEQVKHDGTAGALWYAKDMLKDRFLVMTGDDVYTLEDVEQVIAIDEGWAVLVQEMAEMYRAGSVELDDNGKVARIVEGDLGPEPGIASANLFFLDTRLFTCPLVPKQEGSEEFGLPQTVASGAAQLGVTLEPIYTHNWIQINAPADLIRAAAMLKGVA